MALYRFGVLGALAILPAVAQVYNAGTSHAPVVNLTTSGTGALPDLVVTSLTGSNQGNPAGAINVLSTVLNQGAVTAGAFRMEFYFSPTPDVSLGTAIDTNWGCSFTGLAPGASLPCSGPVGVPASLTPGTWYLAALADSANQVAESNENNNWRIADTGPVATVAAVFTRAPWVATTSGLQPYTMVLNWGG
jgi:subtilase family serine protease